MARTLPGSRGGPAGGAPAAPARRGAVARPTALMSVPTEAMLRDAFAADVTEYLRRTPRQLPSKYFYDELGSSLFEAIGRLPWYRITRAESALLARHAREILRPLPHPVSLAELGCGSGEKLAILVSSAVDRFPLIQLVDVSPAALDTARYRLEALGVRASLAHRATYEDGLERAARHRPAGASLLVLFLGSNIGNFDPPMARDLLARIRRVLRRGDALLLGSDLVKPERELLLAYDDPLQVTAAFNRNLLRRINDELGGTFDLQGFAHRATWNAGARRVEMHLVSRLRQHVRIAAAGFELTFEPDETIWTESSYKYEPSQVLEEGLAAGFGRGEQWIDRSARFVLTRFSVPV
ncbi:MAG: L-histidine N(alpha)-methyltransferase [Acidobacteria bacterium]|nr:L-histidine N(alpha)-methyltransferase [Acidobacteriota bacterium]